MKELLFVLLTLLVGSIAAAKEEFPLNAIKLPIVESQVTDLQKNQIESISLPFNVTTKHLENSFGIEVALEMSQTLLNNGVHNLYIGAEFVKCSGKFSAYVDARDWPDDVVMKSKESSPVVKGARFSIDLDMEKSRFCLSDIGLAIPYVMVCVRLSNMMITRVGVEGTVFMDISIGVTGLSWKKQNLPLYKFAMGSISKCLNIKSEDQCIESPDCGWCKATSSCLASRSDGKADECFYCPRCQFFTQSNQEDECLSKDSCGYCKASKSCEPGDSYGPFDSISKCALKPTNELYSSDIDMQSPDWQFSSQSSGTYAALSFSMIFLGMGLGVILTLFTSVVIVLVRKQLKKRSRPSYVMTD
mmetsp:Transcript_10285/g.15040  ORF Transcript_10285/g.15040 Transcript_10285/m.15040 type:complete len:359 (-) Transcript_10285:60-1136(-)